VFVEDVEKALNAMISVTDSPAPQSDCSCDVLGKFTFRLSILLSIIRRVFVFLHRNSTFNTRVLCM